MTLFLEELRPRSVQDGHTVSSRQESNPHLDSFGEITYVISMKPAAAVLSF